MKVKELIKITALTVGEEETVNYLEGKAVSDLASVKKNVDLLLRCYNLIADELSCEYLPLKTMETFTPENNRIYFSAFSKPPLKILNVYNENMKKVPYKLINDYIWTQKDCVTVEYNYRLSPLGEDDEANYANGIIGPYTIAFGMASQFCLEKGRFNESEIYQEKYLLAIKSRIAQKGSLIIPARRWMG